MQERRQMLPRKPKERQSVKLSGRSSNQCARKKRDQRDALRKRLESGRNVLRNKRRLELMLRNASNRKSHAEPLDAEESVLPRRLEDKRRRIRSRIRKISKLKSLMVVPRQRCQKTKASLCKMHNIGHWQELSLRMENWLSRTPEILVKIGIKRIMLDSIFHFRDQLLFQQQ